MLISWLCTAANVTDSKSWETQLWLRSVEHPEFNNQSVSAKLFAVDCDLSIEIRAKIFSANCSVSYWQSLSAEISGLLKAVFALLKLDFGSGLFAEADRCLGRFNIYHIDVFIFTIRFCRDRWLRFWRQVTFVLRIRCHIFLSTLQPMDSCLALTFVKIPNRHSESRTCKSEIISIWNASMLNAEKD